MLLPVTKIQKFCTHDGPGIRTTVFLKGCPMRCVWCHNPETQHTCPELFYSPLLCIGCGACTKVCPQNIDIPAVLSELTEAIAKLPTWSEICRQRALEQK